MADESIFAFAGICEQWKNPGGRLVETCSIITITPNALCADVPRPNASHPARVD